MEKNVPQGDPLVSIRCTVYNHEPFLRQCLDGFVMQQTSFPFEAIVHDDASTDGSAAIIREYAEKYPHIIKPIYETENQYSKHDGSLVRIMDAAIHPSAKYIATCEGDDYWTDPNKLQLQVDALESHPDCTIALCKVRNVNRDGELVPGSIPSYETVCQPGVITLDDYMMEEYYYARWAFHTSTYLYRKTCMPINAQLRKTVFRRFPYGDQPLIHSCLIQGNGYYIPKVVGNYRVMSGGFTSRYKSDPNKEIRFHKTVMLCCQDLDDYTEGKYALHMKRRIDVSRYAILKIRYDNGMMSKSERIKFLFYSLWAVRSSFSSFKLTLAEFLFCICPQWHSWYKRIFKVLKRNS